MTTDNQNVVRTKFLEAAKMREHKDDEQGIS